MPDGQVLEFSGVTKRFGAVTAVSDFSARVEPGVVTGFLGPNGAGKTTTLRILLGLVAASSGTATIGGVPYAKLRQPLTTVGAVLEASSFHPGRTAANHLKAYAQAARIPLSRVDETLATVGLSEVAGRKVGGFSLGMRQRLGLAFALLGDPGVLVLDEPANGLDPEGIKWMRGLLRQLARQGRTVLVSSHMLTEVQQTVDSLLIISQGRSVFQGALGDLADPSEYATVVDSPDRAGLTAALSAGGVSYEVLRSGLTVRGVDTAVVGSLAAASGVALSSLQRRGPALEEVFLDLVSGARVHSGGTAETPSADEDAPSPVDTAAPAETAEPADADADASDSEAETLAAALEEQTDGSPGAAAAVGAAAAAAAVSAEGESEPDATGDADAEAEPPHAAFAVASTGIVEVIPDETAQTDVDGGVAQPDEAAGEQGESAAEPEETLAVPEEAATEPDADATEPEVAAEPQDANEPEDGATEPEVAAEPEEAAAEPDADATQAEPESPANESPTMDESEDADPAPEAEADKTESDVEADRFFSSFNGEGEPTQTEAGSESEPGLSEPEVEQPEAEQTHPEPSEPEPSETETETETEPEPRPTDESTTDAADDVGAPPGEPSEFGTWSDLTPEWGDHERGTSEGGEQR